MAQVADQGHDIYVPQLREADFWTINDGAAGLNLSYGGGGGGEWSGLGTGVPGHL